MVAVLCFGDDRLTYTATAVQNLSYARVVFTAVLRYAEDHGGHRPVALLELEPRYLAEGTLAKLGYKDPSSRRAYDWLYYPGFVDQLPTGWIVLASPTAQTEKEPTRLKRLVVRYSGEALIIKEADYQRELHEQIKVLARAADERSDKGPTDHRHP